MYVFGKRSKVVTHYPILEMNNFCVKKVSSQNHNLIPVICDFYLWMLVINLVLTLLSRSILYIQNIP
jgi:hypothetical protein